MTTFNKNLLIALFFALVFSLMLIHYHPLPYKSAQLRLGHLEVNVQTAYTVEEQTTGLSKRRTLLRLNEGMLFVANSPYDMCMTMKDTLLPLSVGFFDAQARLIHSTNMTILDSKETCAGGPALYALEMRDNWFQENKIIAGQLLEGAADTQLTFFERLRLGFKEHLGL